MDGCRVEAAGCEGVRIRILVLEDTNGNYKIFILIQMTLKHSFEN